MKLTPRLSFLVGLSVTAVLPAFGKIERTVEKTFSVQPGGTLRVSTQGGEIRVSPSTDGTVKVTARQKINASSDAEADELLKKLELTIEQNGNEISAVAKYEKNLGVHWGSWPPVNVEFIVTVPASFATKLNTSGGGITVGDLAGNVDARTSGGSIRLGKIGAEIEAHTSGGSITLDESRGKVRLSTSGGSITAGRVGGAADLSTSGGSIKIESATGLLRAATSGGSVSAGLAGPLAGDCSLSTSGGGVRVTVDAAAAFQLDASTSGGRVEADGLTIKLEKSNRGQTHLVGSVNGGGPLLKLRSSGGNVTVKTR